MVVITCTLWLFNLHIDGIAKVSNYMSEGTINAEAIGESLQNLALEAPKEKKAKARKTQTAEEFQAQKDAFNASGPRINTEDWLYEESALAALDNDKKTDRVHMLHACERAYFHRDYEKCLSLIAQGEALFGVVDEEQQKQDFENAGRKTKKSSKVERHVVELLHIKEACLKRLNTAKSDE